MSVVLVQNGYYLTRPVLIHVCKQVLSTLDNKEMLSSGTNTQERLLEKYYCALDCISGLIVLFKYLARDSVLDEYHTYWGVQTFKPPGQKKTRILKNLEDNFCNSLLLVT